MSEELWTEVCDIVQEAVIKTISEEKKNAKDHTQERKCKKAKLLSEKALQTAMKRREATGNRDKERYNH